MQRKSSSAIAIRAAAPGDAPVLLHLIHAAFADYAGRLDPPSGAHTESVASLQRLFDAGETAALASVDGIPVGCAFCVRHGVEMYAHRVGVLPAWRGRGIGQALMACVEAQAQTVGCLYVRVAVRLALPGNIDFFARQGYGAITESCHPGYAQPTFIHMTRELSDPRMRQVVVTPYNPAWPRHFAAEAAALHTELGDLAVAIQHIGSTAVPGLAAKPIIDIMPLVRDIHAVDRHIAGMARLGYLPRGEFGLPGRRYFFKATDGVRSHHVHIYQADNPEGTRHLAFRDYLRAHPETARQYGALKLALAREHAQSIEAYIAGKDDFIKTVEARALRWRQP